MPQRLQLHGGGFLDACPPSHVSHTPEGSPRGRKGSQWILEASREERKEGSRLGLLISWGRELSLVVGLGLADCPGLPGSTALLTVMLCSVLKPLGAFQKLQSFPGARLAVPSQDRGPGFSGAAAVFLSIAHPHGCVWTDFGGPACRAGDWRLGLSELGCL